MTPRSIRRAAERKALKAARKAAAPGNYPEPESQACSLREDLCLKPEPSDDDVHPQARAAVNQANARFSTGPRTAQGKAISSLNAVKTGLTGRIVLLPSDDAAAYEQHMGEYETDFKPEGLRERELVQSLADTSWRLRRIPGLEMAIYAQGRVEFEDSFEEHDPHLRASMIDLETHMKYEKQLRNLQLQEARLHRRYEKEMAELRSLQKERRSPASPTLGSPEPRASASVASAAAGFVFSNPEMNANSAQPMAYHAPTSDNPARL